MYMLLVEQVIVAVEIQFVSLVVHPAVFIALIKVCKYHKPMTSLFLLLEFLR